MKRLIIFVYGLCTVSVALAQQDSISRQVTVEREFQPVIQNAGKLNNAPVRLEETPEPTKIVYSDEMEPLTIDFNIQPLKSSEITFTSPESTKGYLEGALGHVNSALKFRYGMTEAKKKIAVCLFADHDADWGRKTLSNSTLGLRFNKQFAPLTLFFDVDGNNTFYTHYGRYYDGDKGLTVDKYRDMKAADKQHIWQVNTQFGVRSRQGSEVMYDIHTGYTAFILPQIAAEHQIRTTANVVWMSEEHHAGANIYVQNSFYTIDDAQAVDPSTYNSRHGLRIEPFYELALKKFRLHLGVNLDVNIGKGQMISNLENVSFAPSPNVNFEYRIIPSWLILYTGAKGKYGFGTLQGYLTMNRYLDIIPGVTSHHVSGYTPVDAYLGFKIRPADCLLMDIQAGYAYLKNTATFMSPSLDMLTPDNLTNMAYFYSDWQQWKVGAEITYHYQDIVHILLGGNYYHWTQQNIEIPESFSSIGVVATSGTAYDRPSWDLHFRIDGRIDSKWSLYSDNHFCGKRMALSYDGDHTLKALVDLRLGVRYEFNRWLGCYFELNNYINRKNDIYYTYQSQGINGRMGVCWKF